MASLLPFPHVELVCSLYLECVSVLLCTLLVCFMFYIPHISDNIEYLSFSVWFMSQSIILSGSIPIAANGRILFPFTADYYSIVPMWHILTHSFVDGHWGCFRVLAIVGGAAVNLWVHVAFWIVFPFSLDIYPGVKLLDHMVVLFSIFWGTSILLSNMVLLIYIPTNNVQGFPFLHILANICYLWGVWW